MSFLFTMAALFLSTAAIPAYADDPDAPTQWEPTLLTRAKTKQIECKKPFDTEHFCSLKIEGCSDEKCWAHRFSLSDYKEFEKKRAFLTAKTSFQRLISNPALQTMCCGQKLACQNWFLNTRLKVITGLSPESRMAHYDTFQRTIEMSEAMILGCENRECLDQFFIHELGHVCQHYRQGLLGMFLGTKACPATGWSIEDFEQTVGVETAKCIQASLLSEYQAAKARGKSPCFSTWTEEAFADTVFSAWRTRPAHWAWSCHGVEDDEHADPRSYLKCIFDRSEPRRSVCGEN